MIIAPLLMLSAGIVLGTLFKFAPIKSSDYKAVTVVSFMIVSIFGLYLLSNYFSADLLGISFFETFASTIGTTFIMDILGGSTQFAAVFVLIGVFEFSLIISLIVEEAVGAYRKRKQTAVMQTQVTTVETPVAPCQDTETAAEEAVETEVNGSVSQEETLKAAAQGLRKDEQSIMEMFLSEQITQITPVLNAMQPEGYSYEGLPQLDWDIKRTRQTLDELVRKGFLKAELIDKVITCTACGSANVRIKKLCPECNSLRLRKEALIEHVSCGTVDRQTAFETPSGELVCPKCHVKLQDAGSDYKLLPTSYVCLNCNAQTSEPLLTAKCDNCSTTAELDEEPEVYLYKYTANSEMPLKEMQQIKPIEVCAKFFRALGYKVVAPASVNGRSGTKHLFDMLVLGKVSLVNAGNPATAQSKSVAACRAGDNTVIELLISSKRVDLEEITRIYGMINDVDCESLIFVIPSMTENARNYASAYNMKVCEGRTIEEALVNWVIPKTDEKTV